jgi:hypothetical protein
MHTQAYHVVEGHLLPVELVVGWILEQNTPAYYPFGAGEYVISSLGVPGIQRIELPTGGCVHAFHRTQGRTPWAYLIDGAQIDHWNSLPPAVQSVVTQRFNQIYTQTANQRTAVMLRQPVQTVRV